MELVAPLLCWDVVAMTWGKYQQQFNDLEKLYKLSEELKWSTNLYSPLCSKFDALVLTDAKQKIQWVSSGFESMTAYTPKEVIGKHPSFLQGAKTDVNATSKIRQSLQMQQQASAVLVNYRKTGEEYLCQLTISPLFDSQNQLSHFLAVEKELIP